MQCSRIKVTLCNVLARSFALCMATKIWQSGALGIEWRRGKKEASEGGRERAEKWKGAWYKALAIEREKRKREQKGGTRAAGFVRPGWEVGQSDSVQGWREVPQKKREIVAKTDREREL